MIKVGSLFTFKLIYKLLVRRTRECISNPGEGVEGRLSGKSPFLSMFHYHQRVGVPCKLLLETKIRRGKYAYQWFVAFVSFCCLGVCRSGVDVAEELGECQPHERVCNVGTDNQKSYDDSTR